MQQEIGISRLPLQQLSVDHPTHKGKQCKEQEGHDEKTPRRQQNYYKQNNRSKSNKNPANSVNSHGNNENPHLATLFELFPSWSEEDLCCVLQETNNDVEVAIARISEERVEPFSQVIKGKKLAQNEQSNISNRRLFSNFEGKTRSRSRNANATEQKRNPKGSNSISEPLLPSNDERVNATLLTETLSKDEKKQSLLQKNFSDAKNLNPSVGLLNVRKNELSENVALVTKSKRTEPMKEKNQKDFLKETNTDFTVHGENQGKVIVKKTIAKTSFQSSNIKDFNPMSDKKEKTNLSKENEPVRPNWSKIIGKQTSNCTEKVTKDKSVAEIAGTEIEMPNIAFLSIDESKQSSLKFTPLPSVSEVSIKSPEIAVKVNESKGSMLLAETQTSFGVPISSNLTQLSSSSTSVFSDAISSSSSLSSASIPTATPSTTQNVSFGSSNLHSQSVGSSFSSPFVFPSQTPQNGPSLSSGGFSTDSYVPRYTTAQTMTDPFSQIHNNPALFGYQMPPYAPGFYNPYLYPTHANPYGSFSPYSGQHSVNSSPSGQHISSSAAAATSSKMHSHFSNHSSMNAPPTSLYQSSSASQSYSNNKPFGMQGAVFSQSQSPAQSSMHASSIPYSHQNHYFSPSQQLQNGMNSGNQLLDSQHSLHHPSQQSVSTQLPQHLQNVHPEYYSTLPIIHNAGYPSVGIPQHPVQNGTNHQISNSHVSNRSILVDKEGNVANRNYWSMPQ